MAIHLGILGLLISWFVVAVVCKYKDFAGVCKSFTTLSVSMLRQ